MMRAAVQTMATAAIMLMVSGTPLHGQGAVERWLLNSCGVGDDLRPALELRAMGSTAGAQLIAAFREGPRRTSIEAVERQARERFARRRALLDRGIGLGLTPDQIALARAVSEQEFVEGTSSVFVRQYRGEALRGLAVVAGPDAREFLREVAADQDSGYRVVAELALRRF